jgi:hypothetical protein
MKRNAITILLVIATLLTLFVGRLAVYNRIIERTGYLQGDGTAHITERVMEIDLRGNVTNVISEKEFTVQNVSLERWITDDLYSY